MFDPFNDFNEVGYLRNINKDKEPDIVKRFEHELFRVHLSDAFQFIENKKNIDYTDFLKVHQILFAAYYPWAGQDRSEVLPNSDVFKGDIFFAHSNLVKRAVNEGLRLGQNKDSMNNKPGEIMGLFAYAHPFLDGNGRTMLLIHFELANRAGYSIAWSKTNKIDYLTALTDEIQSPGKGILDSYLLPFKRPQLAREYWSKEVLAMNGLDGLDSDNVVVSDIADSIISEKYRQFEQRRNYSYLNIDSV